MLCSRSAAPLPGPAIVFVAPAAPVVGRSAIVRPVASGARGASHVGGSKLELGRVDPARTTVTTTRSSRVRSAPRIARISTKYLPGASGFPATLPVNRMRFVPAEPRASNVPASAQVGPGPRNQNSSRAGAARSTVKVVPRPRFLPTTKRVRVASTLFAASGLSLPGAPLEPLPVVASPVTAVVPLPLENDCGRRPAVPCADGPPNCVVPSGFDRERPLSTGSTGIEGVDGREGCVGAGGRGAGSGGRFWHRWNGRRCGNRASRPWSGNEGPGPADGAEGTGTGGVGIVGHRDGGHRSRWLGNGRQQAGHGARRDARGHSRRDGRARREPGRSRYEATPKRSWPTVPQFHVGSTVEGAHRIRARLAGPGRAEFRR